MTEPHAGHESEAAHPAGRPSGAAGSARLVLCTAPDAELAAGLARELLERRLAACVNLLPLSRSLYRWQGRVEDEAETLMLIKTTAARLDELGEVLLGLHPYDTPELVVLEPERVEPRYLAWLVEQVAPREPGAPTASGGPSGA